MNSLPASLTGSPCSCLQLAADVVESDGVFQVSLSWGVGLEIEGVEALGSNAPADSGGPRSMGRFGKTCKICVCL